MITIDTHAVVKNLVASGFTEKEAENMLLSFSTKEETKRLEESVVKPSEFKEAINKLDSTINKLDGRMGELTKDLRHDIANVSNKLDIKIAEVRTDIANTKYEIIKWLAGIIISTAAVMVYFIKG